MLVLRLNLDLNLIDHLHNHLDNGEALQKERKGLPRKRRES